MNTAKTSKAGDILSVRGTAKINRETGDFDFKAYQEGSGPAKEVLKKRGDSQLYVTLGEKESSMVAHLRVKSSTADPVAQLYDDLGYVTRGMQKTEPRVPTSKQLLDREEVKVWHNKSRHCLVVRMEIGIEPAGDPSAKLFNLTSEVNKCLVINQKSLTRSR